MPEENATTKAQGDAESTPQREDSIGPAPQGLDMKRETTPESVEDILGIFKKTAEEKPAPVPEKPTAEKPKATGPAADTLPSGVEKSEDGSLTWKVPGSVEGTVYKGKDIDELMANVAKGIAAKDEVIAKTKTPEAKKPSKGLRETISTGDREGLPEVRYPNRDELLQGEIAKAKELGITPEMLAWGKAEWRAFEDDEGAVNAMLTMQRVNNILTRVDKEFTKRTVDAVNTESLNDETMVVEKLLEEYKIDPDTDGFDWDAVLKSVYDDDNAWKGNGVRKTGEIVMAATKEISKIITERAAKRSREEAEANFAKSRQEMSSLTTPSSTAAEFPQEDPYVVHKSFEDAKDAILKAIREKQRK